MVPKRQVVGAWLLLTGFCSLWLGLAWDGQWHVDVGPDTFFTAPHLMFYFGTALIGLTSLVVVLGSQRDTEGPAVRVFGLRAPLAFLVGGLGSAGHLLYGATDLWWHTVYGFDIVESTPSHLSLQLAMQVQSVAVIMAFAALRTTTSGRWGLVAAGAFSSASAAIALEGSVFDIKVSFIFCAAMTAWTLCAVIGLTLNARWVLAFGLAFAVVQAATFFFPPLVTDLYANSIGQPLRDNALGLPLVAVAMPVVFPAVALIAAGAVRFAQRRDLSPATTMAVLGALTGLAVALYKLFTDAPANLLLNVVAIMAFGALAGRFGWQCAALMRRLSTREAVAA
jgi:hypothetical protein